MRARGSDPDLDLDRYDAEVLRSIVRGTLAIRDEALFQSSATELATLLGARAVIAGELGHEDPSTFRAVVTYVDGELAPNRAYPVPRSEWEEILATGALHVERRAHTRFADDSWIGSIRGERLLGIPLVTDGQVLGLVAVVDASSTRPLEEIRGILELFARGLAVEMGRLRRERLERERSGAALSHRGALLYLAQMHERRVSARSSSTSW